MWFMVCLEVLKESKINYSQNSLCLGSDTNKTFLEYSWWTCIRFVGVLYVRTSDHYSRMLTIVVRKFVPGAGSSNPNSVVLSTVWCDIKMAFAFLGCPRRAKTLTTRGQKLEFLKLIFTPFEPSCFRHNSKYNWIVGERLSSHWTTHVWPSILGNWIVSGKLSVSSTAQTFNWSPNICRS